MRNHDGQQLQNDRSADVRHNAEGEHRQPFQGPSREHVEQTQQPFFGTRKKEARATASIPGVGT